MSEDHKVHKARSADRTHHAHHHRRTEDSRKASEGRRSEDAGASSESKATERLNNPKDRVDLKESREEEDAGRSGQGVPGIIGKAGNWLGDRLRDGQNAVEDGKNSIISSIRGMRAGTEKAMDVSNLKEGEEKEFAVKGGGSIPLGEVGIPANADVEGKESISFRGEKVAKLDPETMEPVVGKDGKPVQEEKTLITMEDEKTISASEEASRGGANAGGAGSHLKASLKAGVKDTDTDTYAVDMKNPEEVKRFQYASTIGSVENKMDDNLLTKPLAWGLDYAKKEVAGDTWRGSVDKKGLVGEGKGTAAEGPLGLDASGKIEGGYYSGERINKDTGHREEVQGIEGKGSVSGEAGIKFLDKVRWAKGGAMQGKSGNLKGSGEVTLGAEKVTDTETGKSDLYVKASVKGEIGGDGKETIITGKVKDPELRKAVEGNPDALKKIADDPSHKLYKPLMEAVQSGKTEERSYSRSSEELSASTPGAAGTSASVSGGYEYEHSHRVN